ncbi:hypothetical protein JOC55_003949 [Paenibacillus sacheonensis]|nr:hypothetical protein [Paenibacillus sacheonensis]
MSTISIHHFEVIRVRFENKEFGIEELQSRLNTAPVPEPQISSFSEKLQDLDDELELILYTQLEASHYQLALNALESFLASLT